MSGDWIVKNPKRSDFCGCPGCPLCYDWAEYKEEEAQIDLVVEIEEEAPEPEIVSVISGVDKMAGDLLGRKATSDERAALRDGAVLIHEGNKLRNAAYVENFHIQHTEMQVQAVIKQVQRERANPPRENIPVNTVVIDNMEESKVREMCGVDAPVDKELIQREQKSLTAAQKRALAEQQKFFEAIKGRQ